MSTDAICWNNLPRDSRNNLSVAIEYVNHLSNKHTYIAALNAVVPQQMSLCWPRVVATLDKLHDGMYKVAVALYKKHIANAGVMLLVLENGASQDTFNELLQVDEKLFQCIRVLCDELANNVKEMLAYVECLRQVECMSEDEKNIAAIKEDIGNIEAQVATVNSRIGAMSLWRILPSRIFNSQATPTAQYDVALNVSLAEQKKRLVDAEYRISALKANAGVSTAEEAQELLSRMKVPLSNVASMCECSRVMCCLFVEPFQNVQRVKDMKPTILTGLAAMVSVISVSLAAGYIVQSNYGHYNKQAVVAYVSKLRECVAYVQERVEKVNSAEKIAEVNSIKRALLMLA